MQPDPVRPADTGPAAAIRPTVRDHILAMEAAHPCGDPGCRCHFYDDDPAAPAVSSPAGMPPADPTCPDGCACECGACVDGDGHAAGCPAGTSAADDDEHTNESHCDSCGSCFAHTGCADDQNPPQPGDCEDCGACSDCIADCERRRDAALAQVGGIDRG